jgi:hypothetical protein
MKRLSLVVVAACGGPAAEGPALPPPQQAAPPAQLAQIGLMPADGATAICPGAPFQVVVTATDTRGRKLATPTSYRGGAVWYEEHGLPWARFRLTSNVGGITPAAMFVPPPSIFDLAETKAVELRAQDLAQPNLTAAISVPVDFHCGQALALRGQQGASGTNGAAGQMGGAGGQVNIAIGRLDTRAHGSVILVRVDSGLGRNYYLLQPGGGALVVDLSGGPGGAGGEGLHASMQYTDTNSDGTTDQSKITYQGPPGPGGSGGAGGSALIRIDASDRLLAQAVKVYNPGGPGGEGGVNRGAYGSQGGTGPMGPAGPLPQITYEDPASIFGEEIAQGFPIAVSQVARRPRR